MIVQLDHLVVLASDLATGEAWATERLGVPPSAHGRHASQGTRNALWGMGDHYFEVIAIDPDAPRPKGPRWFGFDDPEQMARLAEGPVLGTFAVSTDDPVGLAARAPVDLAGPEPFRRDGLSWEVMRPATAPLPMAGLWPLVIRWGEGRHPSEMLPDNGIRIDALTVSGPGAGAAGETLAPFIGRVVPEFSERVGSPGLTARLITPSGPIILGDD